MSDTEKKASEGMMKFVLTIFVTELIVALGTLHSLRRYGRNF
jgi:hypothetical protein